MVEKDYSITQRQYEQLHLQKKKKFSHYILLIYFILFFHFISDAG